MRWKNNLGWTREVHRQPDVEDFDWRVSIAEIDRDCEFSAFPGHDRVLVLLSGNGMRLQFEDGRDVSLQPPHDRIEFGGEQSLRCRLHEGPTHDFNLMWNRQRVSAELLHRPLVGPMLFFSEPGTHWLIHLIAGRAVLKDRPEIAPLDAGDSLLLGASASGSRRAILDGGGEVLLVRCCALGSV
jgi:environmental stress-induced protein Ves